MNKQLPLPPSIEAFIQATNRHDTDQFLTTLSDEAVIIDEGQDHRGITAIKQWSDKVYIGAKVTLEPLKAINRDGKTVVTARVDGNFDKTGLPDPFLMDFHFTLEATKIAALSIRLPGE